MIEDFSPTNANGQPQSWLVGGAHLDTATGAPASGPAPLREPEPETPRRRPALRHSMFPLLAVSTLTLHKIAVPVFCRICDKKLAGKIRVFNRRSFPVVVRKRHNSSAMACHLRLKLQ